MISLRQWLNFVRTSSGLGSLQSLGAAAAAAAAVSAPSSGTQRLSPQPPLPQQHFAQPPPPVGLGLASRQQQQGLMLRTVISFLPEYSVVSTPHGTSCLCEIICNRFVDQSVSSTFFWGDSQRLRKNMISRSVGIPAESNEPDAASSRGGLPGQLLGSNRQRNGGCR